MSRACCHVREARESRRRSSPGLRKEARPGCPRLEQSVDEYRIAPQHHARVTGGWHSLDTERR